jgi:hypothetical protein
MLLATAQLYFFRSLFTKRRFILAHIFREHVAVLREFQRLRVC